MQLNAFVSGLRDSFLERLDIPGVKWIGASFAEGANSDSGWAGSELIWHLPLGPRKNSKLKMHLGFHICLSGEGIAVPGKSMPVPLIHVFLSSMDANHQYTYFPIDPNSRFTISEKSLDRMAA